MSVEFRNRIRWWLVRELAPGVTRLPDPPGRDRATLPRVFNATARPAHQRSRLEPFPG